MFQSLYFKDTLSTQVDVCVDDRYEGSKVNDRSLGKMYYLKQFAKAADEMYNQLRAKIEVGDIDDKAIVAKDKFFNVIAQPRAGSIKIDKDKMIEEVALLLVAVAAGAGAELSTIESRIQATKVIERCSTVGKSSTVISVVETANA